MCCSSWGRKESATTKQRTTRADVREQRRYLGAAHQVSWATTQGHSDIVLTKGRQEKHLSRRVFGVQTELSQEEHTTLEVYPKLTFKLGVPLGRELGREFQTSITGFYTRITELKHTENYLSCLLTGRLVVQSQKLNCIYRNIVSLQT